ncbi:MAG TPA: helix-turn-helix domain-containing protein [Candidatus Nanoarchaeia archaeon]|nr:helix-turn-helix domain-containing protein [Candidatus Nanoarchaeia archaeon]
MVVKQELLNKLKNDFRLNIYEAKIWTVLLSRGIATAGELADLSGVPRSRCYDVLESLEKKGFIIMKIGKPIKYIAVQPEEIIERVKKDISEDTDLSLRMIEEIRGTDVFKELQLLHKTGIEKVDGSELSNSIIGRENINQFLKRMVESAEKSIIISTDAEGFSRKVNTLHKPLKKVASKGIKAKIIAPIDKKSAVKVEGVAELVDKDINGRFVMVDDQLLFMVNDSAVNKHYECAVWVKSAFFTSALREMVSSLY